MFFLGAAAVVLYFYKSAQRVLLYVGREVILCYGWGSEVTAAGAVAKIQQKECKKMVAFWCEWGYNIHMFNSKEGT